MLVKSAVLWLLTVAVLVAAFHTLFSVGISSLAQDSIDTSEMIQASQRLVSEALPDIEPLIEEHDALIGKVNSMQVAEALSGLETYLVSWNISGVKLDIVVVNIEGEWEPISLDVILNGDDSQDVMKIIIDKGMELESSIKKAFTRMKDDALTDENVSIIGFQIHVDGMPVAFLDPEVPSIVPAMISWNSYFLGKIVSFRLVNDYPILKYLMSEDSKHFKVSAGEALAKVESQAEYEVTPQVSRYLLITNGSVRPAYVSYVTPWRIAVVMADTGELLLMKEYTTETPSASETTATAPGINEPLKSPYTALVIAAVVVLAAVLVIRSKLKRI